MFKLGDIYSTTKTQLKPSFFNCLYTYIISLIS